MWLMEPENAAEREDFMLRSKARQQKLYELIKARREINVSQIAASLGMSCMTIRRDLDTMEKENLISRAYGKAMIVNASADELGYEVRKVRNIAAKQYIANLARTFLMEVDSIFIDGSTSCAEMIKLIPPYKKLTVFTSGLESVFLMKDMQNVRTFIMGGFISPDRNSIDSELTLQIAKNINVDAAFVSCSGYSENGLVNNGITGLQTTMTMIENSAQRFLLADNSKYRSRGLINFANWSMINCLITNEKPPDDFLRSIGRYGVKAVWAEG